MKINSSHPHCKHILSAVLISIVAAGIWGLFQLKPQENIEGMIPASLREYVSLFSNSPLNRKLFAVVTAPDEMLALETAQKLRDYLLEEKLIQPGFLPTAEIALSLAQALPFHFLPQDEKVLLDKLTPDAINQTMQENYERLISLEGFLLKPLLQADPLHLVDLMANKLALLNPHTQTRYEDGFLTAQNGTVRVGLYDVAGKTDFSGAQKMSRAFDDFSAQLPPGVQAFFLGGLRYTAENVTAIQHDLLTVGVLALLSLALIFAVFFRRKQALLIYLLPLGVMPLAALVTYAIFGQISGITLGFGSVVAGLSVDYAVYVFFALQTDDTSTRRRHTRKHLITTFITSSLCFAALFSSSVEVFHQIAVFAIAGLLLSLLAALYVFPVYWSNLSSTSIKASCVQPRCSKRTAWMVCAFVLIGGIFGVKYTRFSGDMQSLNASSKSFQVQRAVLQQALAGSDQEQALLFIKGNTPQEALERSELFAEQVQMELPTVALFPSKKAAQQHTRAWRQFWDEKRIGYTKNQLEKAAKNLGISPQAFAPFLTWLSARKQSNTFDLTSLYNPLVELPDGTWAVVNIVSSLTKIQQASQQYGAVFVSGPALQKELLQVVRYESIRMVFLAILLNLTVVSIIFRSVKKALWAFVPVLLAASVTFAGFWLLNIEVNLFVFVFLPLLMGLGIDYGIFQLMRIEEQAPTVSAYPPVALWTAALSTLAGFGVLIFAQHGVLFIMGLSSFLGVGSAMLAAQFILPAFLENTR